MNYLILIIVGVVGIWLGYKLALRRRSHFAKATRDRGLIAKQSREKAENKEEILEFLRKNGKIQNNDVEKLAEVSDATAERYLDELEKEGKIEQHGEIGQGVFYTLK